MEEEDKSLAAAVSCATIAMLSERETSPFFRSGLGSCLSHAVALLKFASLDGELVRVCTLLIALR